MDLSFYLELVNKSCCVKFTSSLSVNGLNTLNPNPTSLLNGSATRNPVTDPFIDSFTKCPCIHKLNKNASYISERPSYILIYILPK